MKKYQNKPEAPLMKYWEYEQPEISEAGGLRVEHYPITGALHINIMGIDGITGQRKVIRSVKLFRDNVMPDAKPIYLLSDVLKKWRRSEVKHQ